MWVDPVLLTPTPKGVRLRLRVKPGASRSRLVAAHGGALKLEVNAPPEKGKANRELVKLLARELKLSRTDIEITAGTTSQDKTVLITGLEPTDLAQRLQNAGIEAEVAD